MLKNLIAAATVTPLWIAALTPLAQSQPPGCLQGYADGTFKGDRVLTRNEFAAGMNACLERVDQLLPTNRDRATRADFEALIRRQRELNAQLRRLNDRVTLIRSQGKRRDRLYEPNTR